MKKIRCISVVASFSLQILAAVLFACVIFCSVCPASASARRVVSIGYYQDGDYMNKTASGEYHGYNIDYLYEIAKNANWQLRFVDFQSIEKAMVALENGRIDIIPALFYSNARAEKYIFSRMGMGVVYNTIMVRSDDNKHFFNDYDSFRGMKVGILAGTLDGKSFRLWDKAKKLNCTVTEMQTEKELLDALDSKRIDAVAITYLGSSSKYRIVAEFDPMEMFFACAKNSKKVAEELDNAMDQINIYNSSFQPTIHKKYFSVNKNLPPVFSKEEQKFIANSKPIKIAIQTDNAPFSFIYKDKLTGAIPDLYTHVEEISGLKFEYVYASSMTKAMEMVRDGKADMMGKMTGDAALASKYGLRLTNYYMVMTMTRVSLKGTDKIWKIGVPASLLTVYEAQHKADSLAKAADVIIYHNNSLAFDALKKHEIDAAYLNTACANYLVNNSRTTDYAVTALSGYDYTIAAAIGPAADDALYSIVGKCLRYTSSMTMNDLVLKYSIARDDSIASVVNRVPTTLIAFLAFIMLAIIFVLVLLVVSLTKHMKNERIMTAEREKTREEEEKLRIAEKANAEKMEFFGAISHDMRTPLNGILGFADLAKKSEDMSLVKDYLGKIKISGELLLGLVNDTLTISKIENQKFTLNPSIIYSGNMMDDVAVPVRSAAAEKGVNFVANAERSYKGYINVDKLNLQKIFLNLLTNAIKFTPKGGEVGFFVEEIKPPIGKLNCKIVVRDSGIGMSADFLPKMFDPFVQERREKAGNTSGTGLGLAIVKKLIDFMGGTIEVKSELNKGTQFTVMLPIEHVENYKPAETAEADTSLLAGKTVLLCEDNQMNQEIAAAILKEKNVKVIFADNGERGVHAFEGSREGDISAVLMDIQMPVMDGYAAARAIRALPRADAASVPIIAMTANAYAEDIQKCIDAGMSAHVAKPIDSVVLFATLQKFIKQIK